MSKKRENPHKSPGELIGHELIWTQNQSSLRNKTERNNFSSFMLKIFIDFIQSFKTTKIITK